MGNRPATCGALPFALVLVVALPQVEVARAATAPSTQTASSEKSYPERDTSSRLRLSEGLEMSVDELATIDIAKMNLLCAKGLPGSEYFDIEAGLKVIAEWTDAVARETRRNWHRFQERPEDYENSEAFYRMGMLITVLQQDFGIRYDPNLIDTPDDKINAAFLTDPSNMFLTGILGPKRTGTCSSMPVLYASIARRLGYPVRLILANDHLFLRWEKSDGSWVNIEGTSHGITLHNDEYYKSWRNIPAADIERGLSLKPLTTLQEISVFLLIRAGTLAYHDRVYEALIAAAQSSYLWPTNTKAAQYLAEFTFQFVRQILPALPFHRTHPYPL